MTSSSSSDAFAIMMTNSKKLTTMDPKINNRKRKTIARIEKDAKVLKDLKAEQRENNSNEMKIDRDLQKEGVSIFDEHTEHVIPKHVLPPPFVFPEEENDDYHVMILTSNVVDKRSLYQIPEKFQENIQPLPDYEIVIPAGNEECMEDETEKKEDGDDDVDDDKQQQKSLQKKYKQQTISPVDPVLQLSCLTKEGCSVLVNCHGFHPSFLIPVPEIQRKAIIQHTFKDNPTLVLSWDAKQAEKERKERDEILEQDPLVQHCCEQTRTLLEMALKNTHLNPHAHSLKWITGNWRYALISKVQILARQNLYGYDANRQNLYYKITVRTERVKYALKSLLMNPKLQQQKELAPYWIRKEYDFFNFTLTTEAEMFRDCDFSAGTWITLNKDTYELTTHLLPEAQYQQHLKNQLRMYEEGGEDVYGKKLPPKREIFMQAEFDIYYYDILSHHPLVPYSAQRLEKLQLPPLAPMRVFSFDIECAGREKHFVDAEIDPICNICGVIADTRDSKDKSKWIRVLFTWEITLDQFALHHPEYDLTNMTTQDLNENITLKQNPSTIIYMCKNEREMLACYASFWRNGGFNIATGYNINAFDKPYMKRRAALLGLKTFTLLSPYHQSMKIIESTFQSRATSVRALKDVMIDGMVVFDMLRWCSKELKLPSLTLNAVSDHILKDKKHDLHHSNITPMFYGTKAMRVSLFEYCVKDCLLPLQLMFHSKVSALNTYLEIAKTTGTTLEILLMRGQGIKSESLLQRYMKSYQHGYICPLIHRPQIKEDIKNMDAYLDAVKKMENQFEGATVIEPKRKVYKRPIGVGDFNSLYPSILISHNLCYTTIILDHTLLKDLKEGQDYIKIEVKKKEDGSFSHYLYFIKKSKRPAFVSFILQALWDGRQILKKLIRQAIDDGVDSTLLEARSNAMKLTSNSCYGMFAGFTLPYLSEISQTVCIIGKQSLEKVKKRVEAWFSPNNKVKPYKEQAEVVYGDTDSVMIDFGVDSLLECNIRLNEAVKLCNELDFGHLPPMKLDGEKMYFPYALYDKKRYGGFKYELFSEEQLAKNPNPSYPKPSLDIKGIETKRRDKIKLLREVVSGILMRILNLVPVDELIEWVRNENIKLVRGEYDLSYIIQSLPVKASYSSKCPGSVLKELLTKRDAANPPSIGSRMDYVIVVRPKASTLPLWARIVPAMDVLDGKETPDYISNGIQKMKKAELRMLGIPGLLDPNKREAIFKYILQPFSRQISNPDRPIIGKIDSYFAPKDKCRVCSIEIDRTRDGNLMVCMEHKNEYPRLLIEYEDKVQKHQKRHDQIWAGCRKCVGEIGLDANTCNNLSCNFWYERKEVGIELKHCQKTLEKIKIHDW